MGYDEEYLNRRVGDCDPRSGVGDDARVGVVVGWHDLDPRGLVLRVRWNTGRTTFIAVKKIKDHCTSNGYKWLES